MMQLPQVDLGKRIADGFLLFIEDATLTLANIYFISLAHSFLCSAWERRRLNFGDDLLHSL